MSRSRNYTRNQRTRVIQKKSNLCRQIYRTEYYTDQGRYSKGKIHCSCWRCRHDIKGKHILDLREVISMIRMKDDMKKL